MTLEYIIKISPTLDREKAKEIIENLRKEFEIIIIKNIN